MHIPSQPDYGRGDSGRVQDLIQMAASAKRNTATYATQDRVMRRISDEQLNAIYR